MAWYSNFTQVFESGKETLYLRIWEIKKTERAHPWGIPIRFEKKIIDQYKEMPITAGQELNAHEFLIHDTANEVKFESIIDIFKLAAEDKIDKFKITCE